jgi:glycosyltransferase involved in cell wall biosynthesis
MTRQPISLAVVVLTFNEEANLAACLASVQGWASELVVVDSGSTDRTCDIAHERSATLVSHAFESHAAQWEWALSTLQLQSEWILALDADQRVTPELRDSLIEQLTASDDSYAGYFVARRQVFRGRWIRHGGYYPKYLLKLFRRGRARVGDDLVDHHFLVTGKVGRLDGDLIEDNRNELRIFDWTEKHNRYARRQAADELARERAGLQHGRFFGTPDERVLWMKHLWAQLPLFVRPVGYFVYRYVLRLGFLDGKEGFVFHVLQAFWYRLLVDINLEELRRNRTVDV